jgi:hypothetical protein
MTEMIIYKGKGWEGWRDWLGTEFLAFDAARTYAREQKLGSREEVANAMRYVAGKALLGIMVVYKTYDGKEGAEVVEDPGGRAAPDR